MAVFRDTDVIVLSSDSESEGGDGSGGGVSVPKSESIFTPTKRASSPLSIPSNSSDDSDHSDLESGGSRGRARKRLKFEEKYVLKEEDSPAFYQNDRELPVYSLTTSGYPASELARILMDKSISSERVCHIQPIGVNETATFIVDIDDVPFSDLKADDLGVWVPKGTKSVYFTKSANGTIRMAPGKPSHSERSCYLVLTRRYYTHGTYSLFRRTVADIRDSDGQRNKYVMVQYILDGPEVDIKAKPHGNSKGNQPFFRTSASTKKRIEQLAVSSTPKAVVSEIGREAGGELEVRSIASVPRNSRQVSYARYKGGTKNCDPLYSVMLECKLAQGTSDVFVQDVKGAPFPMSVLCFDWQLNDMERFLTFNQRFSVLTVDTTFKLGQFYVTPMTYQHLMLEDIKTKTHPIMLGPLLIHQKVDFPAYNYFSSTLISLNKELKRVLAFGTDGDKAIIEALAHNFPYAIQLRCFLHFKKNIERKLLELGLPSSISHEFLNDIFGSRCGNTYQEGLVDSASKQEFDERLEALKQVWDSREGPFAPSSGPRFYSYFLQYQADVVRYHMRRDLRESVGLGSPPLQFTTNASESINAAIKREVGYKESAWPEFNQKMRKYIESQREEILRTLSGRGQYRLTPEFSHLGVPAQMWIKMTTEQRKDCVSTFEKAKLSRSATQPGEEACVSDPPEATSSKRALSVSAEDSGIATIPLVTLNSIWAKASELLSLENGITPAPGSDTKARMVISKSQVTPHHVRSPSDNQYVCDNSCPQWVSSQICSHTIAVSEHNDELIGFLDWYVRSGHTPNLSSIAFSGLPKGRGQKGGRPKRQRTRTDIPLPDNYSVRPGLMSAQGSIEQPLLGHSRVVRHRDQVQSNIKVTQAPQVNVSGIHHPVSVSIEAHPALQGCSESFVGYQRVPYAQPYLPHATVQPPTYPPIQTPTQLAQAEQNSNPFYLKKLSGNIRICQGCRGSLRLANGTFPSPPHDLIVARLEKRQYRDPYGVLKTPVKASAAHYHTRLTCILSGDPTFQPNSLHLPHDICNELSIKHKQLLWVEFGLNLS